jgi:hypothetical protein
MIPKKIFLSSILVASVFAVADLPGRARSVPQGAVYNQPAELKLEAIAKRRFTSYRRQRPGEDFGAESFYPIGWSKDGNFAYYVEPVDEACNCYFARLDILDLKTDKVLWSFDYDSEFIDEEMKKQRPWSFDTLWKANQKLFSDKLREHGIEQQGRFQLLSFPIAYKGDQLTADLKTKNKEKATEEESWYGIINKATLQMTSKSQGRKTILEQSYPEAMPLYVGVVGYVKSPFEPRIAVILMEITRGYEGPPHTGQVKIAGAHLETGFK